MGFFSKIGDGIKNLANNTSNAIKVNISNLPNAIGQGGNIVNSVVSAGSSVVNNSDLKTFASGIISNVGGGIAGGLSDLKQTISGGNQESPPNPSETPNKPTETKNSMMYIIGGGIVLLIGFFALKKK